MDRRRRLAPILAEREARDLRPLADHHVGERLRLGHVIQDPRDPRHEWRVRREPLVDRPLDGPECRPHRPLRATMRMLRTIAAATRRRCCGLSASAAGQRYGRAGLFLPRSPNSTIGAYAAAGLSRGTPARPQSWPTISEVIASR